MSSTQPPNAPLSPLEAEIELKIRSLDGKGAVAFAQDPTRFISQNFDPAEVIYVATKRLVELALQIKASTGLGDREGRVLAREINSALIENLNQLPPPGMLRDDLRPSYMNVMANLNEMATLKEKAKLVFLLGKFSEDLAGEECMRVVDMVGDTFKWFYEGNRYGLSIGFARITERLQNIDEPLSHEDQQRLHEAFQAIISTGDIYDIRKAFPFLWTHCELTPDFLEENLAVIKSTFAVGPHALDTANDEKNELFHKKVAKALGRIATVITESALEPKLLEKSKETFKQIITELSHHGSAAVRKLLTDEIGFVVKKFNKKFGDDDYFGDVLETIFKDTSPEVVSARNHRIKRGFLSRPKSPDADKFGR